MSEKIKLLITGGDGQLAWDLANIHCTGFIERVVLAKDILDITDDRSITHALSNFQPDIVINTAAYTAVDQAEDEPELAYKINATGAQCLAMNCAQSNTPLIHISTDYIFDGLEQRPHYETDLPHPINIYGASKLQGENWVRQYCEHYLILRVSGIFGLKGHNFVKTILKFSEEKEELSIVNDQVTCPTPTRDIAEVLLEIVEQLFADRNNQNRFWGTYHYCAAEPVSWYQFANTIVQIAREIHALRLNNIVGITSDDYHSRAKRPRYSVLNCEKIRATFGIEQKPWRIGLNHLIRKLLS